MSYFNFIFELFQLILNLFLSYFSLFFSYFLVIFELFQLIFELFSSHLDFIFRVQRSSKAGTLEIPELRMRMEGGPGRPRLAMDSRARGRVHDRLGRGRVHDRLGGRDHDTLLRRHVKRARPPVLNVDAQTVYPVVRVALPCRLAHRLGAKDPLAPRRGLLLDLLPSGLDDVLEVFLR